jgi:prepilin-type N-terminal cleavage/methylation domain-containing protein
MNHDLRIKHKGFTLIELLVVVAIIGLMSSIISVAVNTSRTKARDARRINDLKQIKSGMDLYFANGTGYPDTATWDANLGQLLQCSGVDIIAVPDDPMAPTYSYDYAAAGGSSTGCGTTVRATYEVQFYIENKGLYYLMDEDGNVTEQISGNPVSFDSLL